MAAWANYTWEAFCELDAEQMSAHVAAYRITNQIEALLAHMRAVELRARSRPNPQSGSNR